MATNPSIPNAAMPVVGPGNLCTVPWFQFFSFLKSAATNINLPLSTLNGGTGKTQYADGQLLIGDSLTGSLDLNTLTAGPGVTITNGHGNITISAETFTGVISTGSPASGQGVIWTGANAISSGTITTPIIDPNASQDGDGVNVLFSGDLSKFTNISAFNDDSKISNLQGPGSYNSFSANFNYTGTDTNGAKLLIAYNANITYSGTATGGTGDVLQGTNATVTFSGTGTLDFLDCFVGGPSVTSGTVTNSFAFEGLTFVTGGTITTAYGYWARSDIVSPGAITTYYAFYDSADSGGVSPGTAHGFYQAATNHPNFWGSTTEFSLYTQHDYLSTFEVVATDTNKRLVSISNGLSGQVLTSNGASAVPTFKSFSYHNVTSSRAVGTTYTNTQSTVMFVAITVGNTAATFGLVLGSLSVSVASASSAVGTYSFICGFVNPGDTYELTAFSGSPSINNWVERY